MTILAKAYASALYALNNCHDDDVVIRFNGTFLVVARNDAHKMEAEGMEFWYVSVSSGRICFVPVNQGD